MSTAAMSPARQQVSRKWEVYQLACVGVLAVCFCWTAYKAATTSLTIDEAFTWKHWIDAPFSSFVRGFDSNNHPFNTLATLVSTGIFGSDSEIILRLPSLLGGILYFWAIYRIAMLLFGPSVWAVVTTALACGNPLVLDHFATCRGYGLGLAWWTFGTWLILRSLSEGRDARMNWWAGVALALSACSYLTEIYPVAATISAVLVVLGVDAGLSGRFGKFAGRVAIPLLVPTVTASIFLWWFTSHITLGEFLGEKAIRPAIVTFLNATINYSQTSWSKAGIGWGAAYLAPWVLLLVLMGAMTITLGWLSGRWVRWRSLWRLDPRERQLLFLGLALILLLEFLFFEPRLRHHVFFGGRRLLGLWPPLVLTSTLWLAWLSRWGRAGRLVSAVGMVGAGVLILHTTAQFRAGTFFQWEFDAGTKHIAQVLKTQPDAGGKIKIGTSPMLDQTAEYYLRRNGMGLATMDGTLACPHDYYILFDADWPALARFDPVLLYRSQAAGTRLGTNGPRYRAAMDGLRERGYSGVPQCMVDVVNVTPYGAMTQPGVNSHFVHDVADGPESDSQRWTFERPAYLFQAVSKPARLSLHVRLPVVTFRVTGPVTMTVWINGQRLGEERYMTPEDHVFERDVPADWLRKDGVTLVETTMDHYWVAPDDGAKLGYLFIAGGFPK